MAIGYPEVDGIRETLEHGAAYLATCEREYARVLQDSCNDLGHGPEEFRIESRSSFLVPSARLDRLGFSFRPKNNLVRDHSFLSILRRTCSHGMAFPGFAR